MEKKALYSVIIFTLLLTLAIAAGNGLMVFVLHRSLEQIPVVIKFIVHGITLTIFALLGKKYFGNLFR